LDEFVHLAEKQVALRLIVYRHLWDHYWDALVLLASIIQRAARGTPRANDFAASFVEKTEIRSKEADVVEFGILQITRTLVASYGKGED